MGKSSNGSGGMWTMPATLLSPCTEDHPIGYRIVNFLNGKHRTGAAEMSSTEPLRKFNVNRPALAAVNGLLMLSV